MPTTSLPPYTPLPPHLSRDRTIHVIISTLSGNHGAEDYFSQHIHPLLQSHSITFTTHRTTSPSTISSLTKSTILPLAVKGVKQTILLLSGDGGLTDIIHALTTELMSGGSSIFVKPVVCLFPLGTGNAFATSMGVGIGTEKRDDGNDALGAMMSGRTQPIGIFSVHFSPGSRIVGSEEGGSGHTDTNDTRVQGEEKEEEQTIYGAVVFSWGLHASLVAASDTPEYRKYGVERFKIAAGELMREQHLWRGRVRVKYHSDEGGQDGDGWEDLCYPDLLKQPESGREEERGKDVASRTAELDLTSTSKSTTAPTASPANQHVYILATLVSSLEPNFVISPHTKTPDDTLRLVAIRPPPASTPAPDPAPTSTQSQSAYESHLTHILTLAYQNGAHITDPSVVYRGIEAIRIDMMEPDNDNDNENNTKASNNDDKLKSPHRWRQVCIDGKIVNVPEGGWVEVRMMAARGVEGRRVVEVVVPV